MKMDQFWLLILLSVCINLSSIISAMPQSSGIDKSSHPIIDSVEQREIQPTQRKLPNGNNLENSKGNNAATASMTLRTEIPVAISNYKYAPVENPHGDGGQNSPVFNRMRRSNEPQRNPSFANADYLRSLLSSQASGGQNGRDYSQLLTMLEGPPRYDANALSTGGDFDDKEDEPIELYYGKKPQSLDAIHVDGGNNKANHYGIQYDDEWEDIPISLHTSHKNGRPRKYPRTKLHGGADGFYHGRQLLRNLQYINSGVPVYRRYIL